MGELIDCHVGECLTVMWVSVLLLCEGLFGSNSCIACSDHWNGMPFGDLVARYRSIVSILARK